MSVMLNSYFRAFIQEGYDSEYEYTEDAGIQVAGISENFGDVTYIYGASDIKTNEYVITAQIRGADGVPTTTINAYLPENGRSQLLRLAKKKCKFNMHLHSGKCNNPTDFNDFDYGLFFKNVVITGYSTTDLVSRSPDSRSVIDLTFNITMESVIEVFRPQWLEYTSDVNVTNGGIFYLASYEERDCGVDCEGDYQLLGLQLRSNNNWRFVRRYNNTWYNSSIVAGITPTTSRPGIIYTNGDKIIAVTNQSSPTTYKILYTDYSNMDNNSAVFSNIVTSSSGTITGRYHAYGNKLYLGLRNGGASKLLELDTGSLSINAVASISNSIRSVWGYGNTVYIGTDNGELLCYKNNTLTNLTNNLPSQFANLSGAEVEVISIISEKEFVILIDFKHIYATINGGKTWKYIRSFSSNGPAVITQNLKNPQYVLSRLNNELYISYDGGLTISTSYTLDSNYSITGWAYAGEEIYFSASDSTNNVGKIFKTIE